MGTNFFKTGGFGSVNAGKVGNFVAPVAKYTQYVSPGAHMALEQANKYKQSMVIPQTPTPYAGVTPTLADANREYQMPAPMAAPAPLTPRSPFQPTPQPKVGVQPVTGVNPWGRF